MSILYLQSKSGQYKVASIIAFAGLLTYYCDYWIIQVNFRPLLKYGWLKYGVEIWC